jgi:hypothetical protein
VKERLFFDPGSRICRRQPDRFSGSSFSRPRQSAEGSLVPTNVSPATGTTARRLIFLRPVDRSVRREAALGAEVAAVERLGVVPRSSYHAVERRERVETRRACGWVNGEPPPRSGPQRPQVLAWSTVPDPFSFVSWSVMSAPLASITARTPPRIHRRCQGRLPMSPALVRDFDVTILTVDLDRSIWVEEVGRHGFTSIRLSNVSTHAALVGGGSRQGEPDDADG